MAARHCRFFLGLVFFVLLAVFQSATTTSLGDDDNNDIPHLRQEMAAYKQYTESQFEGLRNEIEKLKEDRERQERQIQTLQELCHQAAVPSDVDELGGNASVQSKRSDDVGALEPVLSQVTQRLDVVTADVQAIQTVNSQQDQAIAQYAQGKGTVYVRWGSKSCPSDAETLYTGYAGGSYYNQGPAANHLCLPTTPVFDDHTAPRYGSAGLYGAEYEQCDEAECDMSVACTVCRAPRQALVMIPATNACQDGWHPEYSGYLMTGSAGQSPSEFICVDQSRSYIPGTQGDQNGNLLYYTSVHCASLSCPPYVDGNRVLCVVCSK